MAEAAAEVLPAASVVELRFQRWDDVQPFSGPFVLTPRDCPRLARYGAGMRITTDSTLIAVLLATALLAAGPVGAARSDWREMTVGHFHLYSTLSDNSTRNVARQLQAFENTVGTLLQSDDRLPDVPTFIYILSKKDFQKYAAPRPGLGGFFHPEFASNFLVIDGEMDFDAVKLTVFHEYTHFIQSNTRTMRMPPWYSEGYAELFSSFRIVKYVVTLGELPTGVHLSLEHRDWIPMERLLAVKQSDPEYQAEKLMPQFYGEAWSLVHLLLFDDHSLTGPTGHYLEDVDSGFPEAQAFTSNFPFDKAGLDEAVRKLIRGQVIHIKKLTWRNPVELDQAPIRRMSVLEADTAMARLAFMVRRPPAVVDPLLLDALNESKTDSSVRALGARIAARTHDRIDIEVIKPLCADEALSVQERIDLADALLADGGTTETGKLAIGLLDATVHAPDPPIEAVLLWARAIGLDEVVPGRVIEVLEPASKRVPHNTQILQWLAAANEMLGDKAKTRALYTRIILVSQFEKERAWAQKHADSARLQDDPVPPPIATPAPAARKPKPVAKPPTKH